jgi:hypothetical protein
MTETLWELEGTWEELEKHAPELRGKRLRLVVVPEAGVPEPARSSEHASARAAGPADAYDAPDGEGTSIESEILEMSRRIPEEEWSRVPADLTDQLDHYIYGTPKR